MLLFLKNDPFFEDIDDLDCFFDLVQTVKNCNIIEPKEFNKLTRKNTYKKIRQCLNLLNVDDRIIEHCFCLFEIDKEDYSTDACCDFVQKGFTFIPYAIFLPNMERNISPMIGIHESIHAIQNIKNSTTEQYNEFLTYFCELLIASKLGNDIVSITNKTILNDKICAANDFISDLNFRIEDDEEKYYLAQMDLVNSYIYLLGYFYALELFDIYKSDPKNVLKKVRRCLNNKISLKDLINYYNLNLSETSCEIIKQKIKEP